MGRKIFGWIQQHPALLVLIVQNLLLVFPYATDVALQVERTPAQRGYLVAAEMGCFHCHGPDGVGKVPNPGSKEGDIPGFQGGVQMMYVGNDQELREYVLDGAPARKREDPDYVHQMAQQAFPMPAYRGHMSDAQLEDLMAYLKAASGLLAPPDPVAARGMNLAYEKGCFACHDVMGYGGRPNPGSFKGYIPGWWGSDFDDLVRTEEELREWIAEGHSQRLNDHPIASHFVNGQVIKMPKYKNFLTEQQIEALVRYVQWVHSREWETAQ